MPHNDILQISGGEACAGQCFPAARTLTSASFTDSGNAIIVSLSARAERLNRPCSEVFDANTSTVLGSNSGCKVEAEVSLDALFSV